jgi:hypothetical protein
MKSSLVSRSSSAAFPDSRCFSSIRISASKMMRDPLRFQVRTIRCVEPSQIHGVLPVGFSLCS